MLTTADIAARFNVKRKTVTDVWTKRPDFPPPIRRINRRLGVVGRVRGGALGDASRAVEL